MTATANFPKGILTGALLAVERMLVNSPAFRRRVAGQSEGDFGAADKRVFLFWLAAKPVVLQGLRPFAVVSPADGLDLETFAGGQRNFWEPGGQILLILSDRERVTDARLDGRQAGLDFCGWCDEVLNDLHQMTGTYAPIRRVTLQQKPTRVLPEDEGSAGCYWDASWILEW